MHSSLPWNRLSDMSLFWCVCPLCLILNMTDESVAPDTTSASPKVPAQGLPGMVSLSRNENENSWCHSSPSRRWEGKMRRHAEPNSPAAKDKSSSSRIILETPRPVLKRWLITFNVVTASCIPHDFLFRTDLHLTEGAGATAEKKNKKKNFWCIFIVYKKQSKCLSESHFKDGGLPCALHIQFN